MRALLIFALMSLALAGCNAAPRRAPATSIPAQPEPSAQAWLDPQAQVATAVRLITPNGVDLRQALYLRQNSGVGIVVLTRDYAKRQDGVSDPQALQLLPTGPGAVQSLDPGAQYLPLQLFPAPSRQSYTLAAIQRGEGLRLEEAPLLILQPGKGGVLTPLAKANGVFPLGYVAEHLLACRSVLHRERQGGLVLLGLDWAGAAQVCDLQHDTLRPAQSASFAVNADASRIGGYLLRYDPALPAQAQIEYLCSGKQQANARWTLPYHVSYDTELWRPPLAFADTTHLVTVGFRPDATGRDAKANYRGLFRIVSLDAENGEQRIIEDRVLPYATLVAGGGLVFYVLKVSTDAGPRWEIWAATVDGLSKQRIWSTTEAEYVTVEDILDGRRLLVQRQFVVVTAAGPELHSELTEVSLGTLEQSEGIVAPIAAPFTPAAEEKPVAPAQDSSDLFIPDEPGQEQDSGSDQRGGGTAPGPAPGGDGGKPPPIAVP